MDMVVQRPPWMANEERISTMALTKAQTKGIHVDILK